MESPSILSIANNNNNKKTGNISETTNTEDLPIPIASKNFHIISILLGYKRQFAFGL